MFATNGTVVRCSDCGLFMTNGSCLHGSVAAVQAVDQRADLERDLVKRASPNPPKRRGI